MSPSGLSVMLAACDEDSCHSLALQRFERPATCLEAVEGSNPFARSKQFQSVSHIPEFRVLARGNAGVTQLSGRQLRRLSRHGYSPALTCLRSIRGGSDTCVQRRPRILQPTSRSPSRALRFACLLLSPSEPDMSQSKVKRAGIRECRVEAHRPR